MVYGVSTGFEKDLEIIGVGYRANSARNKYSVSTWIFSYDYI